MSAPVTARVRAGAHVLGLNYDQVADLPIDTRDLSACIDRGLVTMLALIDAEGNVTEAPELPVPAVTAPGGCGCGK